MCVCGGGFGKCFLNFLKPKLFSKIIIRIVFLFQHNLMIKLQFSWINKLSYLTAPHLSSLKDSSKNLPSLRNVKEFWSLIFRQTPVDYMYCACSNSYK